MKITRMLAAFTVAAALVGAPTAAVAKPTKSAASTCKLIKLNISLSGKVILPICI